MPATVNGLTIMTINAARGRLEFDNLFCVGGKKSCFPARRDAKGGLASPRKKRNAARYCRDHPRAAALHHPPRRQPAASYANATAAFPSRFIEELPEEHISNRKPPSPEAFLWRANWSDRKTPSPMIPRTAPERAQTRGPGWQRALASVLRHEVGRLRENTRSGRQLRRLPAPTSPLANLVSHANRHRLVIDQEGNKLTIMFEGRRVSGKNGCGYYFDGGRLDLGKPDIEKTRARARLRGVAAARVRRPRKCGGAVLALVADRDSFVLCPAFSRRGRSARSAGGVRSSRSARGLRSSAAAGFARRGSST